MPEATLDELADAFVAADILRRQADEAWKPAVIQLMDDYSHYEYGEGMIGEPAMKQAVLAAFERADAEPFEALASVLCRDADFARRHPEPTRD